MSELVEAFSIEHVSKSGAKFNPDKAKWFNKEYLRKKSGEELADLFNVILEQKGIKAERDYVVKVCELVKERVSFVKEIWDVASYLFVAPTSYNEKDVAKFWKAENYVPAMEIALIIADEGMGKAEQTIRDRALPMGKIMNCIRLALVGASSGLGIGDIFALIGREEFLRRIENIQKVLG